MFCLGYTDTMRFDSPYFQIRPPALTRRLAAILAILTGIGAAACSFHPAVAQQQEKPAQDTLTQSFRDLANREGEGWRIAESDILRAWSRSGSAAMDLLYQRGEEALDAGETQAAIGHLTALTDHAPDFAAGWQLRAAAFAASGQFGPAVADLARALALQPRNFAALTQLGAMLEETGDDKAALTAWRQSLAIHPHQQEARDGVTRLERTQSGTDI